MSVAHELAEALESARARSLLLLDPLDDAALCAQHSPLMSPLVWDLAHVGNYEDLWLVRRLGAPAVLPEIDQLYDAFLHPRARRPELPLLSPREARDYVRRVRGRALEVLDRADLECEDQLLAGGYVHRMVIQHEHQHDETMLATLQLSGLTVDQVVPTVSTGGWAARGEAKVAAGEFTMGTDLDPWALDNERPAHRAQVDDFFIDVEPVDNAAWIDFINGGGYEARDLWSEAGWTWRTEETQRAPLFWERGPSGEWRQKRFGRVVDLLPNQPVQHICWYEGEAFAKWAGRRLPTESEWEKARSLDVLEHTGYGWEWTSSDFLPYPGFRPFPYREYSEVFFGPDHKVLRGSSWATDPSVARPTFRNWDFPIRRQIFSGVRTARDG